MGTSTSSFGVGKRESHDSTDFYARFVAPEVSDDAELGEPGELDVIHVGDARDMSQVPDASVALVVTSPPYFAGKEYETALGEGHVPGDYIEYLTMLRDVLTECVRILEPGGRIAVNVANLGRRPYRSLAADVTTILQDDLRLLLRGEVIWQKQRGASGSCAWGSYRSPANPVLRDTTERVIIASKGRFDRVGRGSASAGGPAAAATIPGDEFLEATLDVWEIPAESATRVGHPAPFPVALAERCIQLFTYDGDVVLDPFMGSGTTAVASVNTGRHYVGLRHRSGLRAPGPRAGGVDGPRATTGPSHAQGDGQSAARRVGRGGRRGDRSCRSGRHRELPRDRRATALSGSTSWPASTPRPARASAASTRSGARSRRRRSRTSRCPGSSSSCSRPARCAAGRSPPSSARGDRSVT